MREASTWGLRATCKVPDSFTLRGEQFFLFENRAAPTPGKASCSWKLSIVSTDSRFIMDFSSFEQERQYRDLWDSVKIARSVPYTLFTFGSSDLHYYLVVGAEKAMDPVQVSRGKVSVTRPLLMTPYNAPPEFQNFFEGEEYSGMVRFLMSRTAAFSNLRFERQQQHEELISDSVEEVVSRLNRQLDDEEEDRVAILTAPHSLGPLAVLKYTTDRILESAPGNIRELREHGFLPE